MEIKESNDIYTLITDWVIENYGLRETIEPYYDLDDLSEYLYKKLKGEE